MQVNIKESLEIDCYNEEDISIREVFKQEQEVAIHIKGGKCVVVSPEGMIEVWSPSEKLWEKKV